MPSQKHEIKGLRNIKTKSIDTDVIQCEADRPIQLL